MALTPIGSITPMLPPMKMMGSARNEQSGRWCAQWQPAPGEGGRPTPEPTACVGVAVGVGLCGSCLGVDQSPMVPLLTIARCAPRMARAGPHSHDGIPARCATMGSAANATWS